MKANKFVKKFGWDYAKERMEYCKGARLVGMEIDLKRLVESYELVEIHGLEQSKEIVKNAPSDDVYYSWTLGNSGVKDKTVHVGALRKAIADVESCQ